MAGYWEELERPGPDSVALSAGRLRAGSRVRLQPRPGGDVMDIVLAGQVAVVESIEQDLDGNITLAVVVEDDPGRDLGLARQPGHRFFFSPSEVVLLDGEAAGAGTPAAQAPVNEREGVAAAAVPGAPPRVLLAGVGNVFLGDDAFGVALADRLARRRLPAGVEVVDFGLRGMDLAFAMQDGYDAVVLLDATPRGSRPGTLYVIEVETDEGDRALDTHGMDPLKVLGLVRAMGGSPPPTYVVGCEPETRLSPDQEDLVVDLSEPVRTALDEAERLVESLLEEIGGKPGQQEEAIP